MLEHLRHFITYSCFKTKLFFSLQDDKKFIKLVESAAKSTLAILEQNGSLRDIFQSRPSLQNMRDIPKYKDLGVAVVKNKENLLLTETKIRRIGVPKKPMKIMASLCASKLALQDNAKSEERIARDIGEVFSGQTGSDLCQSLEDIRTKDLAINVPLPCDPKVLVVIGFNEPTDDINQVTQLCTNGIEKARSMRSGRYDGTRVRNQHVNQYGEQPSLQQVLPASLVSTNGPINVDVVINPNPTTDDPTMPLLGPSDQSPNVR